MSRTRFSLVSTILNDRASAAMLLDDLARQIRLPDEVVVLDGGSKDGTYEYLLERARSLPFKLVVLQEQGANVSRGRNLAIEAAAYEHILTTDFGCRLEPDWVQELCAPFATEPETEIVTGSWKVREEDIHAPVAWAEWALSNGSIGLVATTTCLASTRSMALKKSMWREFGKYPEDLKLAGDDALFSMWMVLARKRIAAAPRAMCYWHRFNKLSGYLKEARRNMFGCGEAMFWLNYGVYVGGMLVLEPLALAAALGLWLAGTGWIWPGLAVACFFRLFVRRARRLSRAVALLRRRGMGRYWPQVVQLDYGTKLWGVWGFWAGFVHGFKHCTVCRARMRELGIPIW